MRGAGFYVRIISSRATLARLTSLRGEMRLTHSILQSGHLAEVSLLANNDYFSFFLPNFYLFAGG